MDEWKIKWHVRKRIDEIKFGKRDNLYKNPDYSYLISIYTTYRSVKVFESFYGPCIVA